MSFRGFPRALVAVLICQKCYSPLFLESEAEWICDGMLFCQKCYKKYEIKNGILYLLNKEEIDNVRKNEINSRDVDAQNYDKRLASRYEKEVISTIAAMGNVFGRRVIEYGAGTGRLSERIMRDAGQLLAVDFSLASLKLFANKISDECVGLVYADASAIRTTKEYFDVALATQFYEHLPARELRYSFLDHCRDTLKTEGIFVSTTYHHDLRRRMKKQPQEGMHPSNIFFHYFTVEELQNDFEKFFSIERMRPIDITLPFEARAGISVKTGGVISRVAEHIPVMRSFGHLILSVARKKTPHMYRYPSFFFRKEWHWFENPKDISGAALLNFFSYDDVSVPGFKKKQGLTTVIDLSLSEEGLWENMRKKFIREQIKKGERHSIEVKTHINWKEFVPLYRSFRRGKQIVTDNPIVFSHCFNVGAYHDGTLIAGGAFIGDGTHLRALALASRRFDQNRRMGEIIGQANRMIIWETMLYAKKNGYRFFDLGGIDPESNDAGERGLSEFKEGFGGVRKSCYYYRKINSSFLRFLIRIKRFVSL